MTGWRSRLPSRSSSIRVNPIRRSSCCRLQRWSRVADKALRFALNLSADVLALHIECEESGRLIEQWQEHVARPARESGLREPALSVIPSPYRLVVTPILMFILNLERVNPGRIVAVVVPELVESHWYHYLLHNQRANLLKALLLLKGTGRIVVINVPWYLDQKQRGIDELTFPANALTAAAGYGIVSEPRR